MKSLIEIKTGNLAQVLSLAGGSGFISKLYKLGIKEGVKIKVKKKSKICPILLEVNGSTVAVGRGMASKIMVEESK